MFDTIIFASKPWVASECASLLSERYSPERSLVACLALAGPLQFRYERGLAYADYPLISEPRYEFGDSRRLHARSLAEYVAWKHQSNVEGHRRLAQSACRSVEEVQNAIRGAERFVFSADPGPSEAHGCFALLEYLDVKDAFDRTDAYLFSDLSTSTLNRVFRAGSTQESRLHLAHLEEQGRVKRYFDWNWNQNALVVFRAALRGVGLPADAVISKYELQLLYFLAKNPPSPGGTPPWTEGQIVKEMTYWKGTGKYGRQYLGSCASRIAILEHLYQKEFLGRRRLSGPREEVFVTSRAQAFLDFLHPDCEDPDLPARIEAWMEAGFDASRPAIDRYIRTNFGKQKRFYTQTRAN